jgi:hypothetical protein
MIYVVVFVAGAAAVASALVIWYFSYFAMLRKKEHSLKAWDDRLKSDSSNLARQANDLEIERRKVADGVAAYQARHVQYDDLVRENNSLKQDLFNLSVHLKKTERDQAAISQRQEDISRRTNQLADRYLKENVSWVGAKLTPNNYASCKQRLSNVVEACRGIGFDVPKEQEEQLVEDLKKDFEKAVRAEFAREEQARIRAKAREEERLDRERQKRIQEAQRGEAAAKAALEAANAALEKALREAKDEHSVEVEYWKAKAKEMEDKAKEMEAETQRAISLAQMTKTGIVYVISNIGSFGDGVFKIGMTRRLEPQERVNELSGASVPFPYDVQMMISSSDAPGLENALHQQLRKQRVNRVNPHKEFFRADLETIRKIAEKLPGEVKVLSYEPEPKAEQYRDSLIATDEDREFVEQTVQSVLDEEGISFADE